MRRNITISALLVSLLLLVGASIVQAKPTQVTLANAYFADQLPVGADIYVGIRTDDGYIDELDGVLGKILAGLTTLAPNITSDFSLRQLLDQAIVQTGVEGDFNSAIRSWLGDSAGIGMYFGEQFLEHVLVIIDHTNRDAARTFIETVSGGVFDVTEEGAFTVYSSPNGGAIFIALNDEAIYMATRRELIPLNGAPTDVLSNDPDFQKAVGALPSAGYNIVVAGDTGDIAQLGMVGNTSTRDMLGTFLPNAYTAVGATIVNGVSPTIDIVQVGLPEEVISLINTPVDPTFAQYIPADATGVIHGTNLIATYQTAIEVVSANTGQDLQAQLEQAQAIFGFDVIDLLLSGDFAMYFTYKPEGIVNIINAQLEAVDTGNFNTNVDVSSMLEGGFIFEINDPANAQSLITQLYSFYGLLGSSAQGVTATQEEIGGNNALVLTITSPNMTPIEFVIGANETILVMGTRASATAALTGAGGFDSNAFYQTSLRYTLPTMTHYWFLDRNIVMTGTTIFGALSPVIGNVYSNIIYDLENGSTTTSPTPNPTDIARQEEARREQNRQSLLSVLALNSGLQTFSEVFDNTTVSVSSKEGILFVRAVITLSE